jgi:hypothetical protein
MAQKIGNVVAANGSFIQDGVEKTRWIRCGVALQTDKGIRIKLDAVPVGEWDGWLAIYEEEQGQSATRTEKPAQNRSESVDPDSIGDPNNDIPF